ncbi:hypothetical protein DY000_02033358 [Brassica cretica]|uniref:Uncharacterized protein n=1 Tax=Brassica cretica TaxID=69181 RepID=A0ABQ7DZ70_BRACR|nr:hypothetical protein DY000_02033358 [Brassica cretica]
MLGSSSITPSSTDDSSCALVLIMGNMTMGCSAQMIQRRDTTKQSNGSVYGKEELVVKNRFVEIGQC